MGVGTYGREPAHPSLAVQPISPMVAAEPARDSQLECMKSIRTSVQTP